MLVIFSIAVKYRGVPQDLANVYHGWVIEDIQEESRDFYPEPVYGSWESTKNYQDTSEQVGFVSTAREEDLPSPGESLDDEEQGAGWDGEPSEEEQEMDEAFRGGVMSPSASSVVVVYSVAPTPLALLLKC